MPSNSRKSCPRQTWAWHPLTPTFLADDPVHTLSTHGVAITDSQTPISVIGSTTNRSLPGSIAEAIGGRRRSMMGYLQCRTTVAIRRSTSRKQPRLTIASILRKTPTFASDEAQSVGNLFDKTDPNSIMDRWDGQRSGGRRMCNVQRDFFRSGMSHVRAALANTRRISRKTRHLPTLPRPTDCHRSGQRALRRWR